MRRPGFTLLEMLMVVGILTVLSWSTVVWYRGYQVRSDLNLAAEQVSQGISRARLLSLSAQEDSSWGFHALSGTLYRGTSYDQRVTASDQLYGMPPTIAVTGLLDVSFSKREGRPSASGTIMLTDILGGQKSINIVVTTEGIPTNIDDWLNVCHCQGNEGKSLKLPESAWPGHQGHGDHLGMCTGAANECSN